MSVVNGGDTGWCCIMRVLLSARVDASAVLEDWQSLTDHIMADLMLPKPVASPQTGGKGDFNGSRSYETFALSY
jgi:hypothetical protein